LVGSWLDKNLTLQAQPQEIPEDPALVFLFAREFYSEPLDENDPFQLHLNYIQATKMIVEGDYPCNRKEAVLFAALQAQVSFGNHDPNKHVVGWLPCVPPLLFPSSSRLMLSSPSHRKAQFLPAVFLKDKTIEEDIIVEHKKNFGMNAQQAKTRYFTLMRALRSFGISFFDGTQQYEVEDKKNKGKRKTKQRSVKLGVSRFEIVLLEAETNEFLHQFDLEKLKAYVLSPFSNQLNSRYQLLRLCSTL